MLSEKEIRTALKMLYYHCEEEPEAGERIPFSPQPEVLPE